MKCVVIGAGNAGRPAARILNYLGNDIEVTDQKKFEQFPEDVQETLLKMEKEGVALKLGINNPDISIYDAIYISPTIPQNSPVRNELYKNKLDLISNKDISRFLDSIIDIDVIGITGTVGKTSTTHIISEVFKSAGYKVWACSSKTGNLLSEVIVDGIINGEHIKNDIAVLELPHGTIRLMSEVKLKIGLLTNIYSDHLSEFEGSVEKYIERKLLIIDSCEILVSNLQANKILDSVGKKALFYCTKENNYINGKINDKNSKINPKTIINEIDIFW